MTTPTYTPSRVPYSWLPTTSFKDVDRELQRIQQQQQGAYQPVTITHARSPYTVRSTDWHLLADATAGTVTFVFPDAARIDGTEVTITRIDATTNAVTLSGTYGGVVNPLLRLQYESTTIKAARGVYIVVGPNEVGTISIRGTSAGVAAFAGDFYDHVMLAVGYDATGGSNNRNQLANVHQVGVWSVIQANANANGVNGYVCGFETGLGVNAVATTTARAVSYAIGSIGVIGAGSSIQRTIGVMSNDETIGTAGNAFIAPFATSLTFTGNWFIYYDGTRPSSFGGDVTVNGNVVVGAGKDLILPGGGNGISNLTSRFLAVASGSNPALTFGSGAISMGGSLTVAGTLTSTKASGGAAIALPNNVTITQKRVSGTAVQIFTMLNDDNVYFGAPTGQQMKFRDGQVGTLWATIDGTANAVASGGWAVTGAMSSTGLFDISGASAGQIKFPSTQNASANANILDDYAEGTWTPVIGGTGGTSGQAYSQQTGTYTKIGRLIVAEFDVILSTLGTVTGDVQVQGLPIASGGTTTWQGVPIWLALSSAVTTIPARLLNADTAATLFKVTAAATSSGAAFLQQADLSNTTRLAGRFIYYTA